MPARTKMKEKSTPHIHYVVKRSGRKVAFNQDKVAIAITQGIWSDGRRR